MHFEISELNELPRLPPHVQRVTTLQARAQFHRRVNDFLLHAEMLLLLLLLMMRRLLLLLSCRVPKSSGLSTLHMHYANYNDISLSSSAQTVEGRGYAGEFEHG